MRPDPRPDDELHAAISAGDLEVHYQPQVDACTGVVTAVEALVRWRHPTRGLVPPSRFVPEAERSGLVGELGRHVLRTALADMVHWRVRGHDVAAVAVNLSAVELDDPTFARRVLDAVASAGLDPSRLVLELTETALSRDEAQASAHLTALRREGVRIAIDDFGSGYSSLGRVMAQSVDEIKLDRIFVADVVAPDQPTPVLEAAVGMAHGVGAQVVAEGVETPSQLAAVVRAGCDRLQGFLLGHPMPAADLLRGLEDPAA